MDTLPCISLWQPWASLWAHGYKQIETRHWPCRLKFPCVLAVHAAKRWDSEASALSREGHYRECLDQIKPGAIWNGRVCPLPTGAVIGLVRLVGCKSTGEIADPAWVAAISAQEQAFGNYEPGRYGWIADQFRPLDTPIYLRGMQSIWQWKAPAEVLAPAAEMKGR